MELFYHVRGLCTTDFSARVPHKWRILLKPCPVQMPLNVLRNSCNATLAYVLRSTANITLLFTGWENAAHVRSGGRKCRISRNHDRKRSKLRSGRRGGCVDDNNFYSEKLFEQDFYREVNASQLLFCYLTRLESQPPRLILLLCVQGGKTPLMYAAAEGNAKSVEIMIANGANLEAVDEVRTGMARTF